MSERQRRQILRMMQRHGIGSFAYEDAGSTLSLEDDLDALLHPEIPAPMPGHFLARLPGGLERPVFPRPVRKGEIIACLKIGPLLLPVVAEADAILPAPLLEDGHLAGYRDPLF